MYSNAEAYGRVVETHGVCLLGKDAFSKDNAKNMFGSAVFADGEEGWVSWIKERERVSKAAESAAQAPQGQGGRRLRSQVHGSGRRWLNSGSRS